ncbi:MAG: hypothetical protein LWW95_11815 [Candidatus Desulfofervidus auxilii]|nr:hypothetical protein [Candidatus Desulfofervidus auxilii]
MKKILIITCLYTGYLLSDSLSVQTLSILHLPGDFAYDIWIKDTFAYVVGDTGLVVINISDPENPYVRTIYPPGRGRGIYIRDTLAYIAKSSGYLGVDNISDPLNPVEVGRCSTGTINLDVWVQGNFAYVAGYTGGLRIIDIRDPTNPVEVGFNAENSL